MKEIPLPNRTFGRIRNVRDEILGIVWHLFAG
jgi:hypothetical protein